MQKQITLAPPSYFEAMIMAMRRQGFHLLTQVVITNDDVSYHVPTGTSRSTSLFFTLEGRAIIIKLCLYEHDQSVLLDESEKDLFDSHWELAILHDLLRFESRLRLALDTMDPEARKDWEKKEERLNAVPFEQTPFKVEGFNGFANNKCEQLPLADDTQMMNPETVAQNIGNAIHPVADLLKGGRLYQPWLHSFTPSYAYPGCEEIFWDRFGRENLRKFAERPWGAERLRR